MSDLRLVVTSKKQLLELSMLQPPMLEVLGDLMHVWPGALLLGDIYRPPEEDNRLGGSGIHAVGPPYRAVDAKTSNLELETDAHRWAVCKSAADQLNNLWLYDPSRLTLRVAVGDPHGTAPHLHIQVHPATMSRSQAERSHV